MEYKEVKADFDTIQCPFPALPPHKMRSTAVYCSDRNCREITDRWLEAHYKLTSLEHAMKRLNRVLLRGKYLPQADAVSLMQTDAIATANVDTMENLVDVGGAPKDSDVTGMFTSSRQLPDIPLDLSKFFTRPVNIFTTPFPFATQSIYQFNPWSLYLNEPAVRAKLRNYAYIRGDMKVRFIIAGSPFHYGKALISYHPYGPVNEVYQGYENNFASSTGYTNLFLKYLSQSPGAKVMDVRENIPYDMHISYASPQPMIRLFNQQSTALTSTFNDAADFGYINVSLLNGVNSVSSDPSPVTLYVYAWMENVTLGCPTASLLAVETEASDERVKGPVETVATWVSTIATRLTKVPVIGPYAMASDYFAKGVSTIASLFGWSYPVLIDKPCRMRPDPFQNSAQLIGIDTGQRITLDPRQELTIDTSFSGIMHDELALSFLCAKESLLSTFTWEESFAPLSGYLWTCMVHPRAMEAITVNSQQACQPSALAFCAAPFTYWRGDVSFRFEFVCSNFHRGKVAVLFEPNLQQEVLISADLELNKQFVRIVDLQETQSVEFTVNWAFPKAWATNLTSSQVANTVNFTGTLTSYWSAVNGYVAVTPLTGLQSPDSSSIQVNVYIKSDNICFNRFTDEFMPSTPAIFPSLGEVKAEADHVLTSRDVTTMPLNPLAPDMSRISQDHFGETPISFRALLKRFATVAAQSWTNSPAETGTPIGYYGIVPIYPALLPSVGGSTNYFPIALFNYLRYAYMCMRGSLRHRLDFYTDLPQTVTTSLKVALSQPSTTYSSGFVLGPTDSLSSYDMNGTVAYVPLTNAGFEFSVPYYSNNLFAWSFNANPFYSTTTTVEPLNTTSYKWVYLSSGTTTSCTCVESIATDEDFTFSRWVGAPPFVV